MKQPRRRLYFLACLHAIVFGFAASSFAGDDPLSAPKPSVSTMKKSEIPLSVLKDIRRVRPGMTRADLGWLFTPDAGLYTFTPRSYIYRYAGASLAATDATGKPVLDKVTHKPMAYAQAIKIDVSFKPATGRDWATAAEDGTSYRFIDPNGRPDDVIVNVSDPYVGFENDN